MEYGQQSPMRAGGKKERPTAITILAILYVVGGILYIGMGLLLGVIGFDLLPQLGLLCFAIPAVIGILNLVVAWGLWTGQGWARIVAIVFAVLGLLNIPIGTIISIVILIFLFKEETKAFFRDEPAYQGQQQWQQPPQQPQGQQQNTCPNCSSQMRYIDQHDRWYCDSCQEYK